MRASSEYTKILRDASDRRPTRRNQRERQARATETAEEREARPAGPRAQVQSQETVEQREARLFLQGQQDRARRTRLNCQETAALPCYWQLDNQRLPSTT